MDTILHFLLEEPCLFWQLTGLYCPGCGGTRAVLALLKGHPIRSLLYHPLVPYAAVVTAGLLLSWLLRRISRGKVQGLPWRPVYLWAGLGLAAGNWVLRNVLLLAWGIPIG